MKKIIGAQGEITIIQLDTLPYMESTHVERNQKGWIISHSEKGHHHLLTGGNVMERTDNIPEGMKKLYAILEEPAQLIQDAAVPHEGYVLNPGIYEFRIAREYNPFLEQARIVMD